MTHPSGAFCRHPSGCLVRHPSGVFGCLFNDAAGWPGFAAVEDFNSQSGFLIFGEVFSSPAERSTWLRQVTINHDRTRVFGATTSFRPRGYGVDPSVAGWSPLDSLGSGVTTAVRPLPASDDAVFVGTRELTNNWTGSGGAGALVFKFDENRRIAWAVAPGRDIELEEDAATVHRICVDSQGDVFVLLWNDPIDLTTDQNRTGVVKLSGVDGSVLWTYFVNIEDYPRPFDMVVDQSGDVHLTFISSGAPLDAGATDQVPPFNQGGSVPKSEGAIFTIPNAGGQVTARNYKFVPASLNTFVLSMHVDGGGNIYVAGGDGGSTSADGYVAKLDSGFGELWQVSTGDAARAVTVRPSQSPDEPDVVLVGFETNSTWDGYPGPDPTPTANLLALDASDGSYIDHYHHPAGIWYLAAEY